MASGAKGSEEGRASERPTDVVRHETPHRKKHAGRTLARDLHGLGLASAPAFRRERKARCEASDRTAIRAIAERDGSASRLSSLTDALEEGGVEIGRYSALRQDHVPEIRDDAKLALLQQR